MTRKSGSRFSDQVMHDSKTLPRVFSIPPGCAFLPTLVDALLDGRLVGPLADDPAALADITIYVPNRRATRALIALLAERGEGRAQLLPRIVPLGRNRRGRVRADGARGHAAAGGREPQAPDPAARAPPHPHAPRAALVGGSGPGAAAARPRGALHGAGLSRRCGEPRGRSRDPDGRLHHGRHRLACPRTGGGCRLLDLFRDHAPLRADRERELAQDSGRAPGERPGAAAQRPAGGGSEAPHPRASRPSHHRRGLDGLGAGDRKPHGRDRAPAQRRHRAARPRHGSRRGELGDHRRRGRRRDRSGAQPPAGLAQAPARQTSARSARRRHGAGRGAGIGESAQPSALGSPAPGGHHRPLVADLSRRSRRA